MIDEFFPLIKVAKAEDDKEWITPEIKQLILERQKVHKSINIDLYKHLVKKIDRKSRKQKSIITLVRPKPSLTPAPRNGINI